MNVNKVILAGNLTRDPELRTTANGLDIVKFGLATNEKRKDKEDRTTFVDVTAFGAKAVAINKFFKKGKPIFILGRLDFSSWEAADGQKRSKLGVILDEFQFVGAKSSSQSDDKYDAYDQDDGPGYETKEIPF